VANETGAGNFVDSYLGKDETYGTREQFEKGEGIEPYAFDTAQYYDAERGGFVDPKGSMTPQYTNPFWETVGEGGLDPILDFFMIPKGWRGKVDPRTGDAFRTTGLDKVLVGQNINPAGLLTGGAKGLVSAASTKLPALIAMAPIWWQGTTKAFRGQPSLEFVGSAKRGLAFGWGQYFSDRRSIAGGYTAAKEFMAPPYVKNVGITDVATGKYTAPEPDIPVGLNQVLEEMGDHVVRLQKMLVVEQSKKLFGSPNRIAELKGFLNEVSSDQSSVTYMLMYGKDWAKNLRRVYSGKGVDKQGASPDYIFTDAQIDKIIKKGDDIWKDVKFMEGGVVHKWDIADDLVGARGEKLLNWHVKFKDHPKEIQDKIIAALEALSTPTLLTGKALQERLLRLRLDDVLETIHGSGTRFKTAKGEKYVPKPLTEEMIRRDALDLMTGEDIYNLIRRDIPTAQSKGTWVGLGQAQKATSLHLGEHGLDGLSYEARSLSGVKPTGIWNSDVDRNYVIWSQKLLDQMKRLGTY